MRRRDLLVAAATAPALAAASGADLTAEAEPLAAKGKGKAKHGRKDRPTGKDGKGGQTAAQPEATPPADDATVDPAGKGNRPTSLYGMNLLVFITDQNRAVQHFPKGWAERNLPNEQRLRKTGLSFNNACCSACMCSPSRSTLMSGYFPAQHGVKYTLEYAMTDPQTQPQVELPTNLPNLATVMAAAGYETVYKGKWHCSKPADTNPDPSKDPPCTSTPGWVPSDLATYGFQRWDPQDAGANQDPCEAGGGSIENDNRYMNDDGDVEDGDEGILAYLHQVDPDQQPFFLVASLVNPHDVLAYPANYDLFGYDASWLDSTGIELPQTADENLVPTKPSVQAQFLALSSQLGPRTREEQQNYLNFYGNLMIQQDKFLGRILDLLDHRGLTESTVVVLTSDHGEMGITHGGMIQKNFNFYEETLRVPLVWSNPVVWPKAKQSNALVSHVDFLPTVAELFEAPQQARAQWQGVDYASLVLKPKKKKKKKSVQDYVVFTYDDFQSGQPTGPYPTGANHIVSIREKRYKLAKYYDPHTLVTPEWEMYDLKSDKLETRNLGNPNVKRTTKQYKVFKRLQQKLAEVEQTRLQPL